VYVNEVCSYLFWEGKSSIKTGFSDSFL